MSENKQLLCTNRLTLRHFTPADVPNFVTYVFEDAAIWNELVGEVVDHPQEIARELIENWQAEPDPPLVIERSNDRQFMGYIALKPIRDTPEKTELTLALSRIFWGQRYASEAARAMLHYGFAVRKLDAIYGLVYPHNQRGRNLMVRLDMTFMGVNRDYNYGEELAVYVLTSDDWRLSNDHNSDD